MLSVSRSFRLPRRILHDNEGVSRVLTEGRRVHEVCHEQKAGLSAEEWRWQIIKADDWLGEMFVRAELAH